VRTLNDYAFPVPPVCTARWTDGSWLRWAETHGQIRPLHDRISEALGWSARSAQSFSLQALRDLVRPVSPSLADEITEAIRSGSYITRGAP
jgi:hypothetical protein